MTTREAPAATTVVPEEPSATRPSPVVDGAAALAALVLVAIASTLSMARLRRWRPTRQPKSSAPPVP